MKICPECKRRFKDDAGDRCPEDGATLERVAANPVLAEVIPVDESAETRMFESEKIREALDERPADTVEGGTRLLQPDEVEAALTRRTEPKDESAADKAPPGAATASMRGPLLGVMVIAGILVLGLVAGLGYRYWPRATLLRITSAPPGARIEIDGVVTGETPMAIELTPGKHRVRLDLDGHDTFSQEIAVPKGGTPLSVTLTRQRADKRLLKTIPAEVRKRARRLVREIEKLIGAGKIREAEREVQNLVIMIPDDPRVTDLVKRIAEQDVATGKQPAADGSAPGTGPAPRTGQEGDGAATRTPRREEPGSARKLYQAGAARYQSGDYDGARQLLQRSLRADPRAPECHRILARIYHREENVQKTRYHLTRYLELGGADKDLKIRQWLEAH